MTIFHTKSFCGEAKFTLAELGRTQQFSGEDLDLYIKRFHEGGLDCCDAVDRETMVNDCLHGMANEYSVYMENLAFLSFSKLVEAIKRTNESVRRTS